MIYLPSKRMLLLFQKPINLFGFVALLQLLGRAAQSYQIGEKVAATSHAGKSRCLQSAALSSESFGTIGYEAGWTTTTTTTSSSR